MATDLPAGSVPIDDPALHLAPYVWRPSGAGQSARAEATMPGAYLRASFRDATAVSLLVDGAANAGCPPSSMPVLEWSLDAGPFRVRQLARAGELYALPLAAGLDPGRSHHLELYFRAADLSQERWHASTAHVRLAGLALDPGATLLPVPKRSHLAIGFGDSITEGVGVDGLFTSWQSLETNNARAAWFPLACLALDCEYGQLGSGGQGLVRPIEMPVLSETWDHYDATTSRLVDGSLLPEPDYVFCCMGTNDFRGDVHLLDMFDVGPAYGAWLAAVRTASPRTALFCIVPPLGWHAAEIAGAVQARRVAGDLNVYLIDSAPVAAAYGLAGPSQAAYDGVHPTAYGHALLGALVAVEVRRLLSIAEGVYRGCKA